jgi:hypothetical protein
MLSELTKTDLGSAMRKANSDSTSSSTSSAKPPLPAAGALVGKAKKREIFKNLHGRDGGEPHFFILSM